MLVVEKWNLSHVMGGRMVDTIIMDLVEVNLINL